PLFATVTSILLMLIGSAINPGRGSPIFWITLGGIGLAWYGRRSFTRPWDPAKLPGWALRGYQRLLAPDRWAPLRLIGGTALLLCYSLFAIRDSLFSAAGAALDTTGGPA